MQSESYIYMKNIRQLGQNERYLARSEVTKTWQLYQVFIGSFPRALGSHRGEEETGWGEEAPTPCPSPAHHVLHVKMSQCQ